MVNNLRWIDGALFILSVVAIGLSVWWAGESQALHLTALTTDADFVWHMIRATGFVSYIFMAGSMFWGLWLSTGMAKELSPGALSLNVHVTLSWIAVVLGVVHALLLLVDDRFPHTVINLIVPFSSSFRRVAGGMGVMGLWLSVAIAVSFPFKKRLTRKYWKLLHVSSYVGFVMVTIHTILAGSDVDLLGMKVILVAINSLLMIFLTLRVIRHRKL